ncbi:two-component system histidine kinase PnpS [Tumebacillus permanentifrigoris]|uniref:histidine kinase n=1 Tax=Tumebacillus permanentifrigoris TaxID=378543 RepID=A0A316DD94_9BACL|nr:ATP-binding protein [Tumebacillus permanentifrigoris]PWK16197.1 two-component system phosphate regulon sensor histidine kinase PhoR [Tumebacillus permanentifrigoris]
MRGIRYRIVLTYVVLIGLALSIFGVYTMQFIEKLYMDSMEAHVREETLLLSKWVTPHLDLDKNLLAREELQDLVSRTSLETGGRVTILDPQGTVLVDSRLDADSSENQLTMPEVSAAASGTIGKNIRKTSYTAFNMLNLAVPVMGDEGPIAIVRMAVPMEVAHDTLTWLWGRIGISLVVVAVLASLFGLRFAHSIAAPIEVITNTTRKIAEGAYDERIYQRGRDELGVMADSINLMAARISDQIEDLTQQKGKVEGILTHLVSGVFVVDRSGRVTMVNPAAEKMIGVTAEDMLQKWHWEAGGNFGLSTLIDEAILVGTAQKREVTFYKPVERTVEVYITPIQSNHNRIAGAVVLLHDVSDWRRLERMRSEFVANVSHELRTPITAVRGFSETLLDGAMENPEITKQFLQIIHDESERLTRLINELLELSKIESGHIQFRHGPVDLVKLVERTVVRYNHQGAQAGLSIRTELPEQPVELEADGDRVAQVLINLLGNAIAYTTPGGVVTVGVEEAGAEVVLRVNDTGIGIPEEDLPRLFERFYRVDKARARRSGGTGLGLAIVKHIVEGHHGRVVVTSEVGKGSCFRVYLPKEQPHG